ncbi:hypothetical protein D3H55_08545 [Bacillus salacetis]|uniref:Holin n=1 Tax=Bacillus salacetis TaxID=2315464 RepID=A0A3A1R3X6_9BACI|nr:hypothetical protein [Bacillus salacetis]RIW35088.1 hypothetical protein D3H55_08545 [Bacillus salacetis]
MEHFPVIHTNFWDAVTAIPLTIIITQLLKLTFSIRRNWVPTLANVIELIISIFFAQKGSISAGVFMGVIYGNAAVGVYASLKTSIIAFRNEKD